MRLFLILSTIALAALRTESYVVEVAAQSDDVVVWRSVVPDLETTEYGAASDEMFSHKLRFFRTALRRFRLGVLQASEFGSKRSDAEAVCLASKASLCVNANFFDEEGKALGLVVKRGITHQKIHSGGSLLNGIFQMTRRGYSIVDRAAFDKTSAVEAIQAGPRLLETGRKVEGIRDKTSRSRRAGVCIDKNGRLVIFCSSSNIIGMSIQVLQETLLAKGIDCLDALNFDGGGSAQLFVKDFDSESDEGSSTKDKASLHLAGSDEVPVFLTLLPGE